MPRFFIHSTSVGIRDDNSKTVIITGEDASHITRSLRMKEGEHFTACDENKICYDCAVTSVGETVFADVISEALSDTEPPYEAILYQALSKGDKLDTIVQKAVECGVTKIVPFISERCIVRLDKKEAQKKIIRWQKIALEAAKQSGRSIIPEVCGLLTYKEMVENAKQADIPLFCYEAERGLTLAAALKQREKHDSIAIIIGSEGGFSEKEAEYAAENGLLSIGLGKRILRCETASGFVLACLSYAFEL